MIRLIGADNVSLAARATLLNRAYADYYIPLQVTPDQMATMDTLYDVDPRRSVVALAGGSPIGMALLSCRARRGWISAVGVHPEWRGQGIARSMMQYLLDQSVNAGLDEVLLEVISGNERARPLYGSLGFVDRRELLTWRFPADGGPLPVPAERLYEVSPEDALDASADWHDQPPSWQRERATLNRMADRMRAYRLDLDRQAAGYCMVGEGGDTLSIIDVGLNPDYGPMKAGRVLLQALWFLYRGRALTIMNVAADDSLSRALAALHFLVTIRQWEMGLDLRSFAK